MLARGGGPLCAGGGGGSSRAPGDAARRVGMRLERRVPEILRIMLLAYRKAGAGRRRIARESEREADRHRRAVGPLSLALEAQRLRGRDAGVAKQIGIARRVMAFEHEQRKAFVTRQEIAVETAEQPREAVGAELVGLGHGQELDEKARQLDGAVVGSPWMAVARPDRKSEAPVARRRRVEVAHRMDDMVEAARHGAKSLC